MSQELDNSVTGVAFTTSTGESVESLKMRAEKSLQSTWKYLPRRLDVTPKMSKSQEELLIIDPTPGSNTKPISVQHEFCKYLDKVSDSLFTGYVHCAALKLLLVLQATANGS